MTDGNRIVTAMLIGPRDPVLLRDARSFDAEPGARAFTLPWPLPRTVAGALRTHIGNHARPQPFDWRHGGPDRARKIAVHGPLLAARRAPDAPWTLYVPAPRDHVALKARSDSSGRDVMSLRPWDKDALPNGAGVLWGRDASALRPLNVTEDGKADASAPAFWSLEDAWRWLTAVAEKEVDDAGHPSDNIPSLAREVRTHVRMDAARGTGMEGMLFSVESLVFPDYPIEIGQDRLWASAPQSLAELRILAKVDTDESWETSDVSALPLGGERRIATVEQNAASWPAPLEMDQKPDWDRVRGVRLLLVTPAIFEDGWSPGWVRTTGVPPGCDLGGARLKLISAATDRPIPVSGWDLQHRRGNGTTFAARAGSVYFFEVDGPHSIEEIFRALVEHAWLGPVSDREQDRLDGFGLALPGLW